MNDDFPLFMNGVVLEFDRRTRSGIVNHKDLPKPLRFRWTPKRGEYDTIGKWDVVNFRANHKNHTVICVMSKDNPKMRNGCYVKYEGHQQLEDALQFERRGERIEEEKNIKIWGTCPVPEKFEMTLMQFVSAAANTMGTNDEDGKDEDRKEEDEKTGKKMVICFGIDIAGKVMGIIKRSDDEVHAIINKCIGDERGNFQITFKWVDVLGDDNERQDMKVLELCMERIDRIDRINRIDRVVQCPAFDKHYRPVLSQPPQTWHFRDFRLRMKE